MIEFLIPIAFALFVWWFSTVAILYVDGLPKRTFLWSMLAATIVLAMGLSGLALTRNDLSVFGAYSAFTSAVMVWGWQEVGFLLGYITGPRRSPCPLDCNGKSRFYYALQTILYHEFALVSLAIAAYSMTADGSNQVGLWTFAVLWTMRQSAKLNLFLGVRNLGENFLPDQLRYLASYFTRKPMNPLFPISVAIASVFAVSLWWSALSAPSGSFEATGDTLVATLLSLAILEHLLMILPLPTDRLWSWGMRTHKIAARNNSSKTEMEMTSWSAP
jgi:putative photosynthetic complex assembly protein 2